jgi:hypothetical protein
LLEYTFEPFSAVLPTQTWTHVRFDVSFFEDGSSTQVSLQMYLGGGSTPVLERTYNAPASSVPLARARLIPFDFGKGYSVYFDNVSLTANLTLPGAQRPPVARKGR